MSKEVKRRIEAEARKAAAEGKTPAEACPYPFHSEEALHWMAVWMLSK
jgi:hypothetical protein